MFFKKDEGFQNNKKQRLYLFEITFESGMKCVKIGKSSGDSSLDRMFQIQRSYYQKNRCTFICKIKRDRPVEANVFQKETELHQFFSRFQYRPKITFDGSTELFAISLEGATAAYEFVLEGGDLSEYEYDPSIYEKEIDELPF